MPTITKANLANVVDHASLLDYVEQFLTDQGEPSTDEGGMCCYRQELTDGKVLCCGIGALIDDRAYNPATEGQPVSNTYVTADVTASLGWAPSVSLLKDIQQAHDCADRTDFVGSVRREFDQLRDFYV